MKHHLIAATLLAALASSTQVSAADAPEREKCYGVVKAGKNDCTSKDKSHSCAGQGKKDADAHEWVYLPAGLCEKLAGGSTEG